MVSESLTVRCYAQRDDDGSWFAICLDLNLYARANSLREVRRDLDAIVRQYVAEAYGPDREHFRDLIPRRAPVRFWLRYWLVRALATLRGSSNNGGGAVPFDERLPLTLARA